MPQKRMAVLVLACMLLCPALALGQEGAADEPNLTVVGFVSQEPIKMIEGKPVIIRPLAKSGTKVLN